jgi:hypothetical protein
MAGLSGDFYFFDILTASLLHSKNLQCIKRILGARCQVAHSCNPSTQEAEIRRIEV